MECFLCDNVDIVHLNIHKSSTKYRKIPLTSILHEYAGKNIEIVIGTEEKICQTCKLLLDEWDLSQHRLRNIENVIAHKLHRKYHIDARETLPPIKLGESTANLYGTGETGQRFQCRRCSFSTNFIDCLVPHSLFHQNIDNDDDLEIENFPCTNCHLTLPSKASLIAHFSTFHDEDQNNPSINTEDGDCSENTSKPNETLQCTVSECKLM